MSTSDVQKTPKYAAQQIVGGLEEDATWDDIEYAVHVARRIQEGRNAVDRGEFVSSEIAREQLAEWLK